MVTIFMNSENIKTSHPHKKLLNLSDKINLFYQTLVFTIHIPPLIPSSTINNISLSVNKEKYKKVIEK